MTRRGFLLFFLLSASAHGEIIDDSDLSGGRAPTPAARRMLAEGRASPGVVLFPLTPARERETGKPVPEGVSGSILVADRQGRLLPARQASAELIGPDGRVAGKADVSGDGSWAIAIDPRLAGEFRVRFTLGGALWSFKNPRRSASYAWESSSFTLPAPEPVRLGALTPEPGSENAKLGLIHLTFLEALDAFGRQGIALDWWNKPLAVYWPDTSDHFSPWGFELHLTTPHAWDVNLHELGHAVMHLAMRAASGGGQHRVDECYNAALAWSEGWATFFAAVVHLDPADPDARFEFLVPRRAPIRLENVPADVCPGQANEWRVAAALWDFYDLHADGEDAAELPFSRLWSAWAGQRMASLTDYVGLLSPKLSPSEAGAARAALIHNTIQPGDSSPGLGARAALRLAAPDFEVSARR